MVKKIVAIGPESTGKSTLCERLAEQHHTFWCPEYAREYLLKHKRKYDYDDLLTIAKGQVALEEKISAQVENKLGQQHTDSGHPGSNLLFVDTDMYVMKVWCEFVFGKCHQFILDQIAVRKYDLYLLCNIDLEWTPDELREYPDPEPRRQLYSIYKNVLENQSTPWVEISGDEQQRIDTANSAINRILKR